MRVIIASNNKHKISEIEAILGTKIYSMAELGINVEIEETGTSFEENAYIKAKYISDIFPNDMVISDDSGLEVDALNGEPGIYSARYSKEKTDSSNNTLLLKNLEGVENRKANYICVICLIHNGSTKYFKGIMDGEIATNPDGNNGFGYDPLFIYNGKSVASMDESEKNSISHRYIALNLLKEYIEEI